MQVVLQSMQKERDKNAVTEPGYRQLQNGGSDGIKCSSMGDFRVLACAHHAIAICTGYWSSLPLGILQQLGVLSWPLCAYLLQTSSMMIFDLS